MLFEILLGALLILSALVAAAVLWVGPPRSPVERRHRTTPVEDRPDWPGRRD
ncbi:hypothetical protein [Nonomuraea sp. NPDC023979]|uniref:hypothetical protein n=1 Tax=Nonomuraea sp. NPDC023979 TaxID=3154796 RepID=UPI0033CE2142